jgi:hypothetical protein
MCGITLRFKLSIGIDIALAALATAAPAMAVSTRMDTRRPSSR